MTWFALRNLAHRPAASIATFVSLASGTLVVVAALLLLHTGLRATSPGNAATGIDALVVAGAPGGSSTLDTDLPRPIAEALDRVMEGFEPGFETAERAGAVPETLSTDLLAIDGVEHTVPSVRAPAHVVADDDTLIPGIDGMSEARGWGGAAIDGLELATGRAPTQDDEVVLGDELATRAAVEVGDAVRIVSTGEARTYHLVGTAAPGSAPDSAAGGETLEHASVVLFTDDHAHELRGLEPGHVDGLGVVLDPDGDRRTILRQVADVAAPAQVLTGVGLDAVSFPAWANARAHLRLIGSSFLGLVLLVVAIVTASTLSVSLHRRQRELALLRTIASTPRQTRRLLGREAMLVALTAGLVGAPLAYPLAAWVVDWMATLGALPTSLLVPRSPWPALAGIALVTLMARVAAAVSARRPTRGSPVTALTATSGRARTPGRWRAGTGLALAVLGAAGLIVPALLAGPVAGMAGAAVSTLVLIAAVGLLGPWLVVVATRTAARFAAQRAGSMATLATSSVRVRSSQVAVVCTTVVLAGALTSVAVGVQYQQSDAGEAQLRAGSLADHLVVSTGAGIPPGAARALTESPHVASATAASARPVLHSYDEFGFDGEAVTERTTAMVVDPAVLEGDVDLDVRDGAGVPGPDHILVGRERATMAGLGPGDTTELILADGTVRTVEVAGVYDRDLAFGEVVVSDELLAGHQRHELRDALHVRMAPGAGDDELRAALTGLSSSYPGLVTRTRAEAEQDVADRFVAERWLNLVLLSGLSALAYLAVLNTLTSSTVNRKGEFGLLRLAGAHVRQIVRQTRWEATLTAAIGFVLAGAISGAALVVVQLGLTGSPVPAVPPGMLVAFLGLPVLALVLATELATRRVLRHDPVRATAVDR